MTYRHNMDPPAQHDAAQALGKAVARGAVTEVEAAKTMGVIVRLAFAAAPEVDRSGLRARLVWTAKDTREAERRAAVREAKEQEKQLVLVAVAGFRDGLAPADVRRMVAQAAKAMTPIPPVELGDAALKLGQWRAKNGR